MHTLSNVNPGVSVRKSRRVVGHDSIEFARLTIGLYHKTCYLVPQ